MTHKVTWRTREGGSRVTEPKPTPKEQEKDDVKAGKAPRNNRED